MLLYLYLITYFIIILACLEASELGMNRIAAVVVLVVVVFHVFS